MHMLRRIVGGSPAGRCRARGRQRKSLMFIGFIKVAKK